MSDIQQATKELAQEAGIDFNKSNPFKKLHYSTDHLPLFHEFNSLTGLYGRQYIPILKARWYQLHGGILQKPIKYGGLHTDTRVFVAYPLVTEGGKNEIIYSIKSLIRRGIEKQDGKLFTMSEPASFHPEQLIGKYIDSEEEIINESTGKRKKIKRRIENRGHLNNDFLDFDECTKLITSNAPEDQQAREFLSKAENPIGKNEVEKRLTEDLQEHTVKYCPQCTNSYYFQPFKKIPEEAFLQGFLRRKLIPIGNINHFLNLPDESLYNDKLSNLDFSEEDYRDKIINHLQYVQQVSNVGDCAFTDEAIQLIKQYALFISAQGQLHSNKITNYCKVTKFTALSNLMKFSVILAHSHYMEKIDKNIVCLAYMDLVELMQSTFDFIYERTYGDFSYGTSWGGADFKERECLKHLYNEKSYSFESSKVSIEDFVTLCKEVYNVQVGQARNKYLEMKKKGLLDSKQEGQYSSRVWLKITPEEHSEYAQGDKGCKGYDTYNYIFQTRNEILRALKPLQPSQPSKPFQPIKIGGSQ